MLILLFVLSAIILIIGCWLEYRNLDGEGGIYLGLGGMGISIIITLFILLFLYPYNIEEKIQLHEQENEKIEIKLKNTVREYMNYEQKTYKEYVLDDLDIVAFTAMFPDLKSNELIQQELDLYMNNYYDIIRLKEKKINRSKYKKWLYFGK